MAIQRYEMSCHTGPRCYMDTDTQHKVKQYKPTVSFDYTDAIYIYKWLPINKLKIQTAQLCRGLKYCTCAKRETFKQLAGEQCRVICGARACKHTYISRILQSVFCGIMCTQYPSISLFSCDFLRSSVLLHTFCALSILRASDLSFVRIVF